MDNIEHVQRICIYCGLPFLEARFKPTPYCTKYCGQAYRQWRYADRKIKNAAKQKGGD